ncbi:unnamed protein product [Effrenium voratum]|nr:unnamed protein product [Effrenium voratum]
MSFGNALRHTALARSAYLDGQDLGHNKRDVPSKPAARDGDERAALAAARRNLQQPQRLQTAFQGAFGAVSGTVGLSSQVAGMPERRLLRSPRALDDAAAGRCRPSTAPLPGGLVMDIDGSGHKRAVARPKGEESKLLKRHDRGNNVKTERSHSEGDYQGRAFFDQIVLAERYADLIGRSDKLLDNEPLMPVPEGAYPGQIPTSRVPEEEDLPTLLGSARRAPEMREKDRLSKTSPRTSPRDVRSKLSPRTSPRDREFKASVDKVAQDSMSFGRLLREAQATIQAGHGSRTRLLHEQLDLLEEKTRQLSSAADDASFVSGEPSHNEVHKVQRRQAFDLIKRGSGWRTHPNFSQV